jgi:uncharacterized membrane protein
MPILGVHHSTTASVRSVRLPTEDAGKPSAMWWPRLKDHVRHSLWFVPIVCVLGGVALSFGTIAIDRATDFDLIPQSLTGGPAAALQVLSTVATSMVTLTALVLTITMVVVQLAMGQFSPRIVQTILRDKPSQFAIGIFVATFAHAMLAMREVHFGSDGTVPGLAIVVAFFLVVVSIMVLVGYVQHIGRALRVSSLIELVGTDTRAMLDRIYPDRGEELHSDSGRVVRSRRSGVVTMVARDQLVDVATRANCRLDMVPAIGEFVPAGAPLFQVEGDADELADEQVIRYVELSLERTMSQDAAYGFRMLVDIAERSLADSPFLDPTTAVQAIDRLHDCLRQLAPRPFPSGRLKDAEGRVRLVLPTMSWDNYVQLAFDEIRLAGSGSPQVSRRLKAALEDLKSVAPEDRIAPLDRQLELLEAATWRSHPDRRDATQALRADAMGIGVDGE